MWLGDNMYDDTEDSQSKRSAYTSARNAELYSTYGPVAEPKIPVVGTWDDHDYGRNNYGKNYECREASQNEFVYHFNIPPTDPRHPDQGINQQKGIYSSNMFKKTNTNTDGIHVITLDARYHRSPTFSTYGSCEGAASTILGAEQWTWLENELNRPSEIKIIASGTQVLPPTNRGRSISSYCAYDGNEGTFNAANTAVGEDSSFEGTTYESWAEIPQERTKLLHLLQECINAGNANQVIITYGDQHWAEIMTKEIPARVGQAAAFVHEVTASGINQRWPFTIVNTNRLRPGQYSTGVIKHIDYDPSNPDTCSGDNLHICKATANYGGIEIDWDTNEIHLSVYTPFSARTEAVRVTLDIDNSSTQSPSHAPTIGSSMSPSKSPTLSPTQLRVGVCPDSLNTCTANDISNCACSGNRMIRNLRGDSSITPSKDVNIVERMLAKPKCNDGTCRLPCSDCSCEHNQCDPNACPGSEGISNCGPVSSDPPSKSPTYSPVGCSCLFPEPTSAPSSKAPTDAPTPCVCGDDTNSNRNKCNSACGGSSCKWSNQAKTCGPA